MSENPFMQLYVADYMADTRHLSTEEHGAYLLLLMTMWKAGGNLPNDPRKLARISGVHPPKWSRIWESIGEFFDVDGDKITQKRLVKEYEKARLKSISRASAGSIGGKAKAKKNKDVGLANATAMLKHSPEPESEPDTTATRSSSAQAREIPDCSHGNSEPDEGMTDDQLFDAVISAVGLIGGRVPAQWMPPAATMHVGRWRRDLGLPPSLIIATAKQSRARYDEPPNGPKALDFAMRKVAAEQSAEKLTPLQDARRRSGPQDETIDEKRARWRKIAKEA